jgi:hypothetical protein
VGKSGLAETGRSEEKDVVETFPTLPRSLKKDAQLRDDSLLTYELIEPPGSEGGLYPQVLSVRNAREELAVGHGFLF